jgi:hypothetical protein
LAKRVALASPTPEAQVQQAFSLAFQREPTAAEFSQCANFIRAHSLAELCRVLLNTNEFVYVD